MVEIERKFLVLSDAFKTQAQHKFHIAQGYLSSHPERTVRVRIKGESGFITIKGKGNETGTTRFEWETEIPLLEAKPLLALCEKGTIDKMRYEVQIGKHTFEVDEFFGDNQGLVMAELELSEENEPYEKPDWLGEEITNDERYYNAYLSKNPFSQWPK
ncbi:CYTH domain-containing protein [Flavobacterium sp. MAH-1]|uniref:CYTH domain-containing protein n=1 Tax=Flavobacterium agri TaxID=2743471 RepID=A0A7Y8Y3N7_9FLAO|nr:CYTH domain-containing protein [Flavobacterium agri]NUY81314.1 CYTH domain-containing protein [Flavobacterium agri]NYA71338.1 CYTH domain-containing protein [Flavobacterium agri]